MARRRKTTTKSGTKWKSRLSFSWIRLPDRNHVVRGARVSAWLAAIGVAMAAWIVGVPRLQAYASATRRATTMQVRFIDAPPWVRGDLLNVLTRTALQNITGDPLRRSDLVAAQQALLNTGWFDAIEQVRRTREDVVEVRGRFVRPFAVVRDADGDHLVDSTGKLLPKTYAHGENQHLIAISGAYFKRPQRPGQVWEGADVGAGLALIRRFAFQPWKNQIRRIDVSASLKGGAITLLTDKPCTVIWGGAPGSESPLELLADGKMQRLNFLYANHGRIDGGHAGEVDITSERAVVTR
jgi:hypothetical protein